MQEELISKATQRNWKRLKLNNSVINKKLTSRANKKMSDRKIIPSEYFEDPENIKILDKISEKYEIKSILYSLAINLLKNSALIEVKHAKIETKNPYIKEILSEYGGVIIPELLNINLPKNERDILGIVYQTLLSEGSKNKIGSYYTPQKILDGIKQVKPTAKFLDPCCGTGSFLLAASNIIKNPENIYGCDIDENACFIAKVNLILKFPNKTFQPQIFNIDFLLNDNDFPKFDVIATNPPWGAAGNKLWKKKFPQIKSGESYSFFIANSLSHLKPKGQMFFVLPESILNVKRHNDIRKFILDNFSIEKIYLHGRAFSSVLSKVITLHLTKNNTNKDIIIETPNENYIVSQEFYNKNSNNNFSILNNKDVKLLKKIYSIPHKYLTQDSIWAIGIVTGNNEGHLLDTSKNNCEKIYSGKNIKKDEITDTQNYIIYDRKKFQQAADDNIYRAKEKLVYKFISRRLTFAYDNKQRLFLNSANILIPKLEGYKIQTVMRFLNSTLFQYIYTKKFNEVKILKGNLMQLPFPKLNDKNLNITDKKIFELFNLNQKEIEYISKCVN